MIWKPLQPAGNDVLENTVIIGRWIISYCLQFQRLPAALTGLVKSADT
jgi:hypothetical protein